MGWFQANDLNWVVDLDDTLLNTTSSNRTTTLDREDILDRHQEWLVEVTLWQLKVVVHSLDKLHDSVFRRSIALKRLGCRTLDDWRVVAVVTVFGEQLTNVHFNQLNQLWVSQVHFVKEDNNLWHANLVSKQHVLAGLWQWAVVCSNHQHSTVDLSSTSDHVLDIVGVAWHVNVCVVTLFAFVLLV